METNVQNQKDMDMIRQFMELMKQQNMSEQAENFMAVYRGVAEMQVQMKSMRQEIKELKDTNEELAELMNEQFEGQYKGLSGLFENMAEGMQGISESLAKGKNQLLNTANQSMQAFKEKGRQGMERVLQKGITAVKKILVFCKESMMSEYKAYEKIADRIDRTGNELKQIGNDFLNVGRVMTGREKKEMAAPDQGVALTRAINIPVKRQMEGLKRNMSRIDGLFDRLDKVSEKLVSKEKSSVVGKLSQMKVKAEEQHNEQPKLQKEETQEACL